MTTDRRVPRVLRGGLLAVALLQAGMPMAAPTASAAASKWALPVTAGMQPDLVAAPDGTLLLSWVEGRGPEQRLRLARSRDGRWSAPMTVASGGTFGNAVDTPRVRQTPDGAVWVAWLRKGSAGHARDVALARSADGGRHWSAPVPVNTDRTATEHGFASTWPVGRDRLGIAWLDGRAKADADAAQMLRTVTFAADLRRHGEAVLDARVCDCCHTDVADTSDGPLLVYRDRSAGEVRDVHALRLRGGRASAPQAVHADGWVMPGCPVNGPAVAADGARVAVGWYTAAGGTPGIRLATSRDAGMHFDPPVHVDTGEAVLGRVDAVVHGDRAALVWLREDARAQTLWLANLPIGRPAALRTMQLATLAGRGRGTGMPRAAIVAGVVHVVWTDVDAGRPVLRGLRMPSR